MCKLYLGSTISPTFMELKNSTSSIIAINCFDNTFKDQYQFIVIYLY